MTAATLGPPPRLRRVPWWLWAMGALTLLVTVAALGTPEPLVALAVPLSAALVVAAMRLPLKVSAGALFFGVMFLEGQHVPFEHDWSSPFLPAARLLLANLNAVTGIAALRAPLADVLTLVLCVVAVVRRRDTSFVSQTGSVRPFRTALWVSFFCVLALDAWGTALGGNFNESLWQLRQTLLIPPRIFLFLQAFDGSDRELKNLARGLIVVGVLKSVVGLWFVFTWVQPFNREIEFTTSHSDTLLFVPLMLLFINLLVERMRGRIVLDGLLWVPVVAAGMFFNDRRLAYVSLGIGVAITLLLSPPTRFKRLLLRAVVLVSPLVPPYLLAGWGSQGGHFFFGARLIRSLIVGDPGQQNQPDYRDLENINVIHSWSQSRILPTGFGHTMSILFSMPDISDAMPTWQYHPHNQYLWFMTIGGPIGFTLMMLPVVLTTYLSARTYRFSDTLWVRVWSLTNLGIVAAFLMQMFGDMATQNFSPCWLLSLTAALSCKLAVRTGAWPRRGAPAPPGPLLL